MARMTHYSPVIRRELVRALYHERVRRGIPMTRLVDELLTKALDQRRSPVIREDSTGAKDR